MEGCVVSDSDWSSESLPLAPQSINKKFLEIRGVLRHLFALVDESHEPEAQPSVQAMLQRLLERMQRPGSEKQQSPEYVNRLKNCEAALRTLKDAKIFALSDVERIHELEKQCSELRAAIATQLQQQQQQYPEKQHHRRDTDRVVATKLKVSSSMHEARENFKPGGEQPVQPPTFSTSPRVSPSSSVDTDVRTVQPPHSGRTNPADTRTPHLFSGATGVTTQSPASRPRYRLDSATRASLLADMDDADSLEQDETDVDEDAGAQPQPQASAPSTPATTAATATDKRLYFDLLNKLQQTAAQLTEKEHEIERLTAALRDKGLGVVRGDVRPDEHSIIARLREENAKLRDEIQRLQAGLNEQYDEMDALQQKIEQSAQAEGALEEALAAKRALQNALRQAQAELQEHDNCVDVQRELEEELQARLHEIGRWKAKYEEEHGRLEELRRGSSSRDQAVHDLAQLEAERDRLADELEFSQRRNTDLQSELRHARKEGVEAAARAERACRELEAVQLTLRDADVERAAISGDLQARTDQLRAAQAELARLRQQAEELGNAREGDLSKIRSAELTNEQLIVELDTARKQITTLQASLERARSDITQLRSTVLSERTRSHDESMQISDLQDALRRACRMVAGLRRELRQQHSSRGALDTSVDSSRVLDAASASELATALEKLCASLERHVRSTLEKYAAFKTETSQQQAQQNQHCLRAADSIDGLAKLIWGRHYLPPVTRAEGFEGVCEKLELLSDSVARLATKWANDAQVLTGTQSATLSTSATISLEQSFEKLGATAQWARDRVSSEASTSRQQIDELQRQLSALRQENMDCLARAEALTRKLDQSVEQYTKERNARARLELEMQLLDRALTETWDCVANGSGGSTCPRNHKVTPPRPAATTAAAAAATIEAMNTEAEVRTLRSKIARQNFVILALKLALKHQTADSENSPSLSSAERSLIQRREEFEARLEQLQALQDRLREEARSQAAAASETFNLELQRLKAAYKHVELHAAAAVSLHSDVLHEHSKTPGHGWSHGSTPSAMHDHRFHQVSPDTDLRLDSEVAAQRAARVTPHKLEAALHSPEPLQHAAKEHQFHGESHRSRSPFSDRSALLF